MTAKEMANVLSEKTRMPVSLILTVGGIVVGLVVWGTRLEARVANHVSSDESATVRMAENIQAIHDKMAKMQTDIEVIKVQLEAKRLK